MGYRVCDVSTPVLLQAAIVNMVEMYLNPDNEKMWEESSENNPEVAAAALALTPA